MSVVLLSRLKDHIVHLLTGCQIRYFRWHDADLNGAGNVVLFRMAGSGGASDHLLQSRDVSMQLICAPDAVQAGDALMLSVVRFLRSEDGFTGLDAVGYEPLATSGPAYLENGRARFELVIRCLVEDH